MKSKSEEMPWMEKGWEEPFGSPPKGVQISLSDLWGGN